MTEPKADSSSGGEFNSNMTADQLHKRPVNDTEKNGSHYQADEESQQNNNNVVVEGATDLSEPTEWLADVGYYDILKQFSLMGWVAFGGPAAHIALFQKVSLGIAWRGFKVQGHHRMCVERYPNLIAHWDVVVTLRTSNTPLTQEGLLASSKMATNTESMLCLFLSPLGFGPMMTIIFDMVTFKWASN